MLNRPNDVFYSSLSDEQKEYFSEAIKNMGWVEFCDCIWQGGKSTKNPDNCSPYYAENYTTERLYSQLQTSKELASDEEM